MKILSNTKDCLPGENYAWWALMYYTRQFVYANDNGEEGWENV